MKKLPPLLNRICLALLLLFASARAVEAWSFHTHRKITADAIRLMPEAFQQRFTAHKTAILKGSTDPDTIIKDFYNHVYHVSREHNDGEARLKELRDIIVSQIRKGESETAIAYTLGLLSHYIADFNQPLHTAGSETDPYEDEYHSAFEKDVERTLRSLSPDEPVYEPVSDSRSRLHSMASEANRYYLDIGRAYRGGKKLEDLEEVVRKQYKASVKNICDFWLGIFEEAGHPFQLLKPVSSSIQEDSYQLPQGKAAKFGSRIDINSGSLEELMTIPQIGRKRAQTIINGRPYRSVFDLSKLSGFSPRLIENISGYITVTMEDN